jgi:DNA primase
MQRERKLAALRRALHDDGYVKGDEAFFFCTYSQGCNGLHHKRKLQVNLQTDLMHCWVCGFHGGSLLKILWRLGEQDPDYLAYKEEVEAKRGSRRSRPAKEYERVRLPAEFRTLSRPSDSLYSRQALAYLTSRGVTPEDILDYKLGYCAEGRYAERVIVPSFDEYGELNFFVGRGVWERVQPPYLSGEFDKDIVFNDLLVDWRKPVTLVEGPFDAFKAGHNAVALQGKRVPKRLMAKILQLRPRVVVALDHDAPRETLGIAAELVNSEIETLVVSWPQGVKDPGVCTKEQFEEIRRRAVPVVSAADILKRRAVLASGSVL